MSLVSKRFVIETNIFPPDFTPSHEGNAILKLISLSSYSYLTIELGFETIKEICHPPIKRKNSSKPKSPLLSMTSLAEFPRLRKLSRCFYSPVSCTKHFRTSLQAAGTEEKRSDGDILIPSFLKTLAILHDF